MKVYHSPTELAMLCRSLRKRAKLTQQELADAIGEKTAQAISNAERARGTNRLAVQRRILEHFGKSVEVTFRVN